MNVYDWVKEIVLHKDHLPLKPQAVTTSHIKLYCIDQKERKIIFIYYLHTISLFLLLNQRKNSTSTPATTAPNVAPTTLRPPSTPRSTTCPGEPTTRWAPGARCPSTAPGPASTSPPPPRTRTRYPHRRSTPAPPSTGRRAASAPRTSCSRSGRATRCPACPRTSNTSTTKP